MTVESASSPARSRARLGLWVGGIYLFLATALFILTALGSDKTGLEWIPFAILTMPWSRFNFALAIPGALLNAVILWALATALQVLFRGFRGK